MFEIASLKRQRQSPLQNITPQKVEAVSKLLAEKLSENTPLAKACLKATVNEIRVTDDLVSLSGQSKALAHLVAANGKIDGTSSVPGFREEWWTTHDGSGHRWSIKVKID